MVRSRGRSERPSSGNRQRPERKKNKPRRTRFSKTAAMAIKNEDGYSSDGSASDWNPDSPAENSSDEEKVCNMIVTNSFEGNSSNPDSDSEIEHDNSDTESDGEKGKMWYCQALKV